jgi:hypothetical protein
LALLLATPTPTQNILRKRQNRQNRPNLKTPFIDIEAILQPIIPQKRQKTLEEKEEIYEFRANSGSSIFSSITRSPSVIPATLIGNLPNILDIKAIIQSAISPLIIEIKKLKEEIKQLKTPLNNTSARQQAQQTPKRVQPLRREKTSAIEAKQA